MLIISYDPLGPLVRLDGVSNGAMEIYATPGMVDSIFVRVTEFEGGTFRGRTVRVDDPFCVKLWAIFNVVKNKAPQFPKGPKHGIATKDVWWHSRP